MAAHAVMPAIPLANLRDALPVAEALPEIVRGLAGFAGRRASTVSCLCRQVTAARILRELRRRNRLLRPRMFQEAAIRQPAVFVDLLEPRSEDLRDRPLLQRTRGAAR